MFQETTFTDTSVSNGEIYYYIIKAENDVGESDSSDEVSASPKLTSTPATTTTPINSSTSTTSTTSTHIVTTDESGFSETRNNTIAEPQAFFDTTSVLLALVAFSITLIRFRKQQ